MIDNQSAGMGCAAFIAALLVGSGVGIIKHHTGWGLLAAGLVVTVFAVVAMAAMGRKP